MTRTPIPPDSDFTLANLPFGIFSTPDRGPRAGIAVGDHILDLALLGEEGLFSFDADVLVEPTLNPFIRLGKAVTNGARSQVQSWLESEETGPVHDRHWIPRNEVKMHLPVTIGDYTDFYSSIEHATNVGKLFRDPDNALLPNWRHLPIGYHGRASSIVIDGTPIHRPSGQILSDDTQIPGFQPTKRLDFELEMAFVIGKDSTLGEPVPLDQAETYIFGLMLFNDWSARDIQRWEYVPLGPFLGKNFASSVSPWIVPLEAFEPFRVPGPRQSPEALPYLRDDDPANFDIDLAVKVNERIVSRTNFKNMYWSMRQQVVHHSSNGCNLRVGDLMASGTISGSEPDSYGSLLEITENGRNGEFLQDGDTVTMTGHSGNGPGRVGFGAVSGQVLPARNKSVI